ncbi:hypothetical protein QYG89_02310 [Bacillus sp. B190/17]|uniref:SPOR domain-containing protein n=1 Tax=Bacillus lumedeiriae TaxID=3058829 RepID=A0ABW8I523_9BACI
MDKPKKSQGVFITIGGKKKQERKELIVQSLKKGPIESAAAAEEPKKAEEEEFQWIFPNETERRDDVLKQYAPVEKAATKRATGKLFIIVISAVLIGVLFGYALVKIITQKEEAPPQAVLKEETVEQKAAAPSAPSAPTSPKTTSAMLLPLEITVVQGGVFSTKDAAASVKQQIKSVGLPAEIVAQNGQYTVLLAVSSTMETAKIVGGVYEQAGVSTYAKQTSVSPAEGLQGEAGKLAALLPVVAEESGKSAAGLSVDTGKLQEVNDQLKAIKIQANDEASAQLKKLLTAALTEAKSDQPQAAKTAQEKLLAFLSVYGK